jgi:hypothetical protein
LLNMLVLLGLLDGPLVLKSAHWKVPLLLLAGVLASTAAMFEKHVFGRVAAMFERVVQSSIV